MGGPKFGHRVLAMGGRHYVELFRVFPGRLYYDVPFGLRACVCVCVCVCARVCVFVCVREREREREALRV